MWARNSVVPGPSARVWIPSWVCHCFIWGPVFWGEEAPLPRCKTLSSGYKTPGWAGV